MKVDEWETRKGSLQANREHAPIVHFTASFQFDGKTSKARLVVRPSNGKVMVSGNLFRDTSNISYCE